MSSYERVIKQPTLYEANKQGDIKYFWLQILSRTQIALIASFAIRAIHNLTIISGDAVVYQRYA
ncbi:hypothetical protein ACI3PL_12870, partial [Lacticaseibacillus paracasei]